MCQGQETSRDAGTLPFLLWEFTPLTPTSVPLPLTCTLPPPLAALPGRCGNGPCPGLGSPVSQPCVPAPGAGRLARKPHRTWGSALAPGEVVGCVPSFWLSLWCQACPGARESRG